MWNAEVQLPEGFLHLPLSHSFSKTICVKNPIVQKKFTKAAQESLRDVTADF